MVFQFKGIVYFDNTLDCYFAVLRYGISSFEDSGFVVRFWAWGSRCAAEAVMTAEEDRGMTLGR